MIWEEKLCVFLLFTYFSWFWRVKSSDSSKTGKTSLTCGKPADFFIKDRHEYRWRMSVPYTSSHVQKNVVTRTEEHLLTATRNILAACNELSLRGALYSTGSLALLHIVLCSNWQQTLVAHKGVDVRETVRLQVPVMRIRALNCGYHFGPILANFSLIWRISGICLSNNACFWAIFEQYKNGTVQ